MTKIDKKLSSKPSCD